MNDFDNFPKLPGSGLFNIIFAIALIGILGTWAFMGWAAYQAAHAVSSCNSAPSVVVHTDKKSGDKSYSVSCTDKK